MTSITTRFSIHPNDNEGAIKTGFSQAIDRIVRDAGERSYAVDWNSIEFSTDEQSVEEMTYAVQNWRVTTWTDVDVTVRVVKK